MTSPFFGIAKEGKMGNPTVTIFFCQQLDPDQDTNRRALEKELGSSIRFFPLPCSGRIESLHLMRALEGGSDKVYLVTCPDDACRYGEGNKRARKRVAFAQKLIEEVGLSADRLELFPAPTLPPFSIDDLARELYRKASGG